MLLNGYGSYIDLMKIMETYLLHVVTRLLIQMLETTTDNRVKAAILEILFDECSYIYAVGSQLGVLSKRDYYEAWARHLRDEVEKGMSVYQQLLNDSESFVKQAAQDL